MNFFVHVPPMTNASMSDINMDVNINVGVLLCIVVLISQESVF